LDDSNQQAIGFQVRSRDSSSGLFLALFARRQVPTDARRFAQALISSSNCSMSAQTFVSLIEELIDLKLQRYAALNLRLNPGLSVMLQDKRETDRQRLDQIRNELIGMLETNASYPETRLE
jgi:hypothetical protein